IVRREQWPVAARLAAALGLVMLGYAILFAVLLFIVRPAWLLTMKPEKSAPAPEPVRGELSQGDTWEADVEPATGTMTMDTWDSSAKASHNCPDGLHKLHVVPAIDQGNLNDAATPKKLPGEPFVLTHGNDPVSRIAFAPDGKTLASLDGRDKCRLWNTTTG